VFEFEDTGEDLGTHKMMEIEGKIFLARRI
jgi:hypothetical protein